VENNLAWVNAAICNEKNCDQAICLEKCPTKAITAVSAAADDPVNAAQAV
jgi:Fe-S-cluster-containing hydrogenase component 2